jgi:DnaK suppressor protein
MYDPKSGDAPDFTDARTALSDRLTELEGRAKRLMIDITAPLSADFEEQAVEAEDDDSLIAQESLIMARIAAVRAAITRVDQGRYGVCTACGEDISVARLKVLPEASQCIGCATKG